MGIASTSVASSSALPALAMVPRNTVVYPSVPFSVMDSRMSCTSGHMGPAFCSRRWAEHAAGEDDPSGCAWFHGRFLWRLEITLR
jgi:hypothetical protein